MKGYSIRQTIAAIHCLLFILCSSYIIFWSGPELHFYDEHEYVAIATNIVQKGTFSVDGIHPTAFRAPLYPALLSIFLWVGASIIHLKLVNAVLFTAASFLLSDFLAERYSPTAGLLSSVMVFLYPVLIYTAGTLYPQILGTFLIVVSSVMYFTTEPKQFKHWIFIGLINGLLVLTLPMFLFIPLAQCAGLIRVKRFAALVLMIVMMTGTIGPWTYRNAKVFDQTVFISTNAGINLLLGNSEDTRPDSGTDTDIDRYTASAPSGNEAVVDSYYRQKAVEYILHQPFRSLQLFVLKFLNFFNYRNHIVTASVSSVWKDGVMLVTYGALMLLTLFRIVRRQEFPLSAPEKGVMIVYILGAFFHAVFFTRIRFRLPLDLLLVGFCANTVGMIFQRQMDIRSKTGVRFRNLTSKFRR